MIATLILAVGISAAMDAIVGNNNHRKHLDENAMADLVLRQMAARLSATGMTELGHIHAAPEPGNPGLIKAQAWTLHLRATDAGNDLQKADPAASPLSQPWSASQSYKPPFRPLSQQDLVEAGIIREPVGVNDLRLYVEYYNLHTEVGLQNIGGVLVPAENGLIRRYSEIQNAGSSDSSLRAWYSLVGDPKTGTPPSDMYANHPDHPECNLILPAVFSVADVDKPGTPNQIRGASNHGLVIRILVSWRPGAVLATAGDVRQWRETFIVKRD